jgi:ATP-dependent DNA helicase RecG
MQYELTESKILEFKECLDDYGHLCETVTAFANTQGGTIIVGIRDTDRLIIGLSREEIEHYSRTIPQAIVDMISNAIAVDLYEQNLGGKVCVTIRVYPGPHKPYYLKKLGFPLGVYLRFGSHNRKADSYAIEQFSRYQKGLRYEQIEIPLLAYEDLSKELLENIFVSCNRSILINSGYAVNEVSGRTVPNVAGTLLFYPNHQRIIAESHIVVSHYADNEKRQLIKKEEFSGGIIPMLEHSYSFISALLGKQYEQEGLIKRPVEYDIPLIAIREALVNAVVHRAYDYETPTRITLFPDRIEFLNAGTFYAPINPENLKEGLSRYRNPLIADALRKKGYMEKQGIGINLIISSCLEANLSEPQFIELEHHVKLVMFKKSSLKEQVRYSYNIKEIKNYFSALGSFSAKELAHYMGRSTSMAKKNLFEWRQEGLIEMIGKGPATKYRFIK